jgi:hypothetical protein
LADKLAYQDKSKFEATIFFINEETLSKSPLVEILSEREVKARAILDSGSEVNLLSQDVYNKLVSTGIDIPTLPLENVILVTAFSKRSSRVKKQAMVAFSVGTEAFEANFFISPQLVNDAILGCQFMKDYGINLNFDKGSFSYSKDDEVKEHTFCRTPDTVRKEHCELCYEEIPASITAHASPSHFTAPAERPLSLSLSHRST